MILKNKNSRIGPSFSFQNRLMRLIWNSCYFLLFLPSPRNFFFWRTFILKLFGAKIGKKCRIHRKVNIWAPWNLKLGNYVAIDNNVKLYNMDMIYIDDDTTISDGAYLCCGSHDYKSKQFKLFAKPIIIKKRVWICAQVFIHPGIIIEDGCVVGARSVVNKNLKIKNSVYDGHPCEFVKEYDYD